jgi:hypothetical protein
LPPPSVCGLLDASAPMTAIDLFCVPSGSTPPEYPSLPGMSMSRPALAGAAVECVAPQSEVTNPWNAGR